MVVLAPLVLLSLPLVHEASTYRIRRVTACHGILTAVPHSARLDTGRARTHVSNPPRRGLLQVDALRVKNEILTEEVRRHKEEMAAMERRHQVQLRLGAARCGKGRSGTHCEVW